MSRVAWSLLLVATVLALPAGARAQTVNRCVGADGRSIYSDQPCHSVGAVARQAPARPAAAGAHGFTTGTGTVGAGCSRSIDALLMGVRGALESGDVNRLATHYHWPGTSARGGRYLMDELEDIARRPFVAIDVVYPEPPSLPEQFDFGPAPVPAPAETPDPGAETPQSGYPLAGTEGGGGIAAAPSRQARPSALRIEQATSATDPGSTRTDFLLRRHAGCWWIEL